MIHVASDAGIWGEQATGLYSVTKAAVVMLGKMLALDGGQDGGRSNVLCPGDIWPVMGVWRLSARLGYREQGLSGAVKEGFMGLAGGSLSADAWADH